MYVPFEVRKWNINGVIKRFKKLKDMYYNEKLINGLWYYKTMPRMEWKPMSIVQLTNKIAAQERELNKLTLTDVVKSDSEQLSKRPSTSSTWECFSKADKQKKGNV